MKKNYIYNLLISIVNILFPILSFPYASRILGSVGIGKVQIVSSFAIYFSLIAALGIPIYGIQAVAKVRHNRKELSKVFSELIIIHFVMSIIVSVVYVFIISFFSFFAANIQLYYYSVLIVIMGFTSVDWFYIGLEEFRIISVRAVVVKIAALIFLFFFVKNLQDVRMYLFIFLFSILGNNFISFALINKSTSFIYKNINIKKHLRPLIFIFATNIATSMYMILDSVILGFLSTESAVGLYTASVKLTKISVPFITSLGVILLPNLSKGFNDNNQTQVQGLLNKSFLYISFFSIPIAMGLYVLAPEFIYVFSGMKFLNAIPCMQILSLLPVFIGFGYFFSIQILVPLGKNKEIFYSVVVGMLIGFALNFLFVPRMNEKGAAIANVTCEAIVTILYYYFIKKEYSFHYDWGLLLKSLLSSLFFIPIVLSVRSLNLNELFTLSISIVICSLSYFMAQYYFFKNQLILKIIVWLRIKITQIKN